MRVITIGREFGAGARDIARELADRLGWKLFDRELIDEIAKLAHVDPRSAEHCDERLDSWVHRLGKGFWAGGPDRGPAPVKPNVFDADLMAELAPKVITDIACAGQCVIVGRGAAYVLEQRNDAFHVFVYAPLAERVRRVMARGTGTEAQARELIEAKDRERQAYVEHYYRKFWPDRHLYDLMINSALGDSTAVDLICVGAGLMAADAQDVSAEQQVFPPRPAV